MAKGYWFEGYFGVFMLFLFLLMIFVAYVLLTGAVKP